MSVDISGGGDGRTQILELLQLAGQLRDEKLFVAQEKRTLHGLFTSLDENSREVLGLNWILQQLRCVASDLILGCPNVTPDVCFSIFNTLEELNFMDGYKLLTHHEIKVGKFLKGLRENPPLVALCLMRAEETSPSCLKQTTRTVMLQLYEGLMLPEDEVLAVSTLRHLLKLEVSVGKLRNPVKFVSKRHCAFVQAYRFLVECLPSSKPYLTVTFHDPTIALIAEDEWLYDIDIDKALSRFNQAEISRRFGEPETESFKRKVETYRSRIVGKLISLVEKFLIGLEFGAPIFPQSLRRVLREAFDIFCLPLHNRDSSGSQKYWSESNSAFHENQSKSDDEESFEDDSHRTVEANKACLFLLLNIFVCPAVCNPEMRGIVFDVPVGEVARHNLIQIAQLLQVLALQPFDGNVDIRYKDVCDKFDKGCLSFLLDSILNKAVSNDNNQVDMHHHGDNRLIADDHPRRSSVIISPHDFVDLMDLVQTASSSSSPPPPTSERSVITKELNDLIVNTNLPSMSVIRSCCQKYLSQSQEVSSPGVNNNVKLVSSYSPSTAFKKHPSTTNDDSPISRSVVLNRFSSVPLQRPVSKVTSCNGGKDGGQVCNEVLVINLGVYSDCPGMMSEQKVLERELKVHKSALLLNSSILLGQGGDDDVRQQDNKQSSNNNLLISGKRTRFSLSHDTDSIEPNNEGVSEEGVSSHSTDDEDNNSTDNNSNDNLSDMAYSANLSGRNTPSIVSGRDTPVSLISGGLAGDPNPADRMEGERIVIAEVVMNSEANHVGDSGRVRAIDAMSSGGGGGEVASSRGVSGGGVVSVVVSSGRDAMAMRKRDVRRDDVTDKFGKFDIKQDIELEAKSTVSDTWSTDVLASDSEPPPEQNHLVRLEEVVEENAILPQRVGGGMGPALSETGISETASDAWSTDVLASDTSERQADRLLELDQDETCSLSGRSTLSLVGLESGLEKNQCACTSNKHHHQQPTTSNINVIPATNTTLTSHHDAHQSEVFDNYSDSSSHKGASSSFDVFDPTDGDASNIFVVKEAFESLTNQPSPSIESSNDYLLNNDNKPFKNNNIHNADEFLNSKFLQDLSDDSGSNQNLGKLNRGPNYDEGFEIFDPFAPCLGVRLQGRDLAKSTNSSSADNLDTLAPSCTTLLSNSRPSSSSMTHIFDDPTLSSPCPIEPSSYPQSRNKENQLVRSEMKKKSSLFGTFRERLSKVSQASNNRRKTPRNSDEPIRTTNPHVLIDFDRSDVTSESQERKSSSWKLDAAINTEIILAKYRKSPSCETSTPSISSLEQHLPLDNPLTTSFSTSPLFHHPSFGDIWGKENNSKSVEGFQRKEGADVFRDAKKKLRMVLSSVDCSQLKLNKDRTPHQIIRGTSTSQKVKNLTQNVAMNETSSGGEEEDGRNGKEDLMVMLKMLLADSVVSDDKVLAAQLQETIRCLYSFDSNEIKKLLKSMKEDYKMRSYYVAYLTRCKKSLLSSMAYYDALLKKVKRERSVVNKYLVSLMTRLYLERRELQVIRFISDFQRLVLFDEKSDLLDKFLYNNLLDMKDDPCWRAASNSQLHEAQLCMERSIMSQIYMQALFPNADGDILRDKKMEDHMRHLTRIITPDNKYLKIPPTYHNECPWLAAQKELTMINAFKTPEDKLECVVRCCSTIMTLLSLALTGGTFNGARKGSGDEEENVSPSKTSSCVPAADDFMPVLIYVVIMSCIPNLLSTVQYIKSYCERSDAPDGNNGGKVEDIERSRNVFSNGEKYYWWMQFVAAVEFIKTMEYCE